MRLTQYTSNKSSGRLNYIKYNSNSINDLGVRQLETPCANSRDIEDAVPQQPIRIKPNSVVIANCYKAA